MTSDRQIVRPYDFLLDDATGWLENDLQEVSLADGNIQLETHESLIPSPAEPNGTFGGHTLPRGVAIWGDEIYVSDTDRHRIMAWRPCDNSAQALGTIGGFVETSPGVFDPAGNGPRNLDTPLGMTISFRDDLVIVDSENRRLLLFTLPGLGLRRIIGPLPSPIAGGDTWRPVDVTTGPGNTFHVADADGLIWRLDSQGRPDSSYWGRLPDGVEPVRVLTDSERRAYVVHTGGDKAEDIIILDHHGRTLPSIADLKDRVDWWLPLHIPDIRDIVRTDATFDEEAEARAALMPSELSVLMDAELHKYMTNLMAEEARLGSGKTRDEIWTEHRDAAYVDSLAPAYNDLLPQFLKDALPESRLSLKDNSIWLAHSDPRECWREPQQTRMKADEYGQLALDDYDEGPYLIHRPSIATYKTNGLYSAKPLDSGELGNTWHRVALELDAPDRTAIRLFSFTSDVLKPDLEFDGLTDEPPDLGDWHAAPDNADEWLIQSRPGRYLYLAAALKGPGDVTPSISRIQIYMRRESSLAYLPAVYQSDETSRHLLDRLLSMTDTIFEEIETRIEDFPSKLDVDGAPPDFLPWLASWFDLSLEQMWTEQQRRDVIDNVMELYRWRGTVYGMRLLLQLHTGLGEPLPQIIEHYRESGAAYDQSEDSVVSSAMALWLGDPPQGDSPHHFSVMLPAYLIDTADKRRVIERLLNANTPAHTHYTLRPIYPRVQIGSDCCCAAAIGVDSLLGTPAPWSLPSDTDHPGGLGGIRVLPARPVAQAAIKLGQTRLRAPHRGCTTCQPCE